ncbi:AcrR family transcriptional regulator [Mycolicibacterium iranicum]|uniref:AcrR family transcriptional regulator n=1 Tax=Mycolicibacterium iranicum TaxID=912594 RepID=A0A839QEX5_MYCIR|nr:TetR/AcrR family transcriptional regulator [Mycolicibacterium iranicum]MBB2992706.1 AcrR family transcriptional regulator [Mycolicibacterium iranicum]
MAEDVKRAYRSDLRRDQARDTRRRIVAAASELFVAGGYAGTTVDAIAEAAGVSRKTVFGAVGGKAELLATALNWAVAGDDEPVPLADRAEVRELLARENPHALIDGWVEVLVGVDARVGELFAALEHAATTDEVARALLTTLNAQRREGARAVVDALAALGALDDGLTRAEAVDVACLFADPVFHRRLVGARRWSIKRFTAWLAGTLHGQLLNG